MGSAVDGGSLPYISSLAPKIGLVGAGKMGCSIFALLWKQGWDVTVLGRNPAEMDRQNRRLLKRLDRANGGAAPAEGDRPPRPAGPRFTTSWDDLRDCALGLETLTEHLDTKIQALRQAEDVISPHAILASNTSSLSITRLATGLRNPRRLCG